MLMTVLSCFGLRRGSTEEKVRKFTAAQCIGIVDVLRIQCSRHTMLNLIEIRAFGVLCAEVRSARIVRRGAVRRAASFRRPGA